MKGPGYKLAYDVRRTWRCPACGAERKMAGDVTSMKCNCRAEGTFMTVAVERNVASRPLQTVSEHDVRSSEFGIDDMPVLQPRPESLPAERTGPRRPRPGSDAARAEAARQEAESAAAAAGAEPTPAPAPELPAEPEVPPAPSDNAEDDWGAGIL